MKPSSFLMQEATLLHRQGQLAEAAARYEQVLAQEKKNPDALFVLATIHCQQGRLERGHRARPQGDQDRRRNTPPRTI